MSRMKETHRSSTREGRTSGLRHCGVLHDSPGFEILLRKSQGGSALWCHHYCGRSRVSVARRGEVSKERDL